jgi:ketosteroid isomerase-like protein
MNQLTERTTSTPAATAAAFYGALLGGDADGARRLLADDAVLHVPGTHPLAGDHAGPEAILGFVARSRVLTDDGEHIELVDLLEGATHAAAYCRITAERRGRTLDNTTVHLLRVEGGRIAEGWLHNFDDVAVDRFWS